MTTPLKYFTVASIGGLLVLAWFAFAITAHANPSFFIRQQSASATTTVTYITAGTATTTLTYDTGNSAAGSADGATLLVQFNGSSTLSLLNANIEYSQDSIDWYIAPVGQDFQAYATTTVAGGAIQTIQYPYASTTPLLTGAVANGTATTSSMRIVNLKTPTRYIRAVFTIPVGALNGAFWAEFIGKRQNP